MARQSSTASCTEFITRQLIDIWIMDYWLLWLPLLSVLKKKSICLSSVFSFRSGEGACAIEQARQMLYHWVSPPALWFSGTLSAYLRTELSGHTSNLCLLWGALRTSAALASCAMSLAARARSPHLPSSSRERSIPRETGGGLGIR